MQAIVRIAAVLALVLSLGLHWGLLQTVAWTGMLINHSRTDSFREALTKTFDGEHPCCLCKAIEKGRAEEKKQEQEQTKPGSKLDMGLVWQPVVFDFRNDQERSLLPNLPVTGRREAPPKPRPRPASSDSLV